MGKWLITSNRSGAVALNDIPVFGYEEFFEDIRVMLEDPSNHCTSYFAVPDGEHLLFISLMLKDETGEVYVGSYLHDLTRNEALLSLTALYPAMHSFEREISENYGVTYKDNPWNKPLRFPHDRADRNSTINNYPFYSIAGDSLHEVNVGPIHAGIIEPGVFRFICNGEEVIHLEIVLGYQHRGIEKLMRQTHNRLRQTVLAETIAGDCVAGHTSAYVDVMEKLGNADGYVVPDAIRIERAIALELERIAMHLADTGALCMDTAYQLGQVACEALRTIVINTTQFWCGNRFAKGLIRPFGTHYPLTTEICEAITGNLTEVERRYKDILRSIRATPSVLARFEDCGIVSPEQAMRIGAVGMAARASGLKRDIRRSHPSPPYADYSPVMFDAGDVFARLNVRAEELFSSVSLIGDFIQQLTNAGALTGESVSTKEGMSATATVRNPRPVPDYSRPLKPVSLSFSLTEGWRGEICHVGITDEKGNISYYKIKDPSMHNWMMLALSVRGGGISDFPVCNKSFNLSYCGHDL